MSRPVLRTLLAAALAGAVAAASALPAEAGHRHHHRHGGGGDAFAAGVAGALLGAIIASPRPVYGAPVYVEPAPVYVAPAPVYLEPQPVYVEPAPVYVEPQPVYAEPGYRGGRVPLDHYRPAPEPRRHDGPRVVTYEDTVGGYASAGSLEPWSPGWREYCRARFRSFDARTGTYLGYDGNRHFCVAR